MSTMKHWALAAMAAAALTLAGCGGGGSAPPQATGPDPALGVAKMAAMTAATAADMAADAAEMAANAQTANMSADEANYALAQNAATRARAAADAAQAASDAAAATGDTAEAQKQQGIAEAQQALAETEQANAEMYAGMVADAQQAIDDENQRVIDVADARSRAMQSYMDADADATKAENAADMAEATAPNSPGAMAARAAADAARMAANAAKAAHDAIMDGMSKAEADDQASMAATQAGTANAQYMVAKAENDTIQTAAATGEEQNRQRDVMAATSAASDAAVEARKSATAARMSATSAREAANAARQAYMMAMAARTDSETAQMEYMAADEAATMAENAATAAEMAADAAEAAHMGIDPAGTAADAQAAQMTAETKQGEAADSASTASTQYMTAMTASGDAATAASTHVLMLFLAANGAHVMDDEDTTTVDEKAAHVTSVGAAMAAIAAATGGAQGAGTTATLTWPGDTVDNPATEDDPATLETVENNEFSEGMLGITVTVAGTTAIVAELRESRAATDLNGDGETDNTGEAQIIQTAKMIANLGDFRGYDLWEDDGDATTNTDRARAILFTDKQKGDDSVLAVTAATARSVVGEVITAATELSNVHSSGRTITGVTWTPSGEAPLTGTLTCGDTCDITLGADGAVTAIEGYTFTGSRAARAAVTAADATDDNDYLAFGLWLEESDDGATDTFGAFAVGGTGYAVNITDTVTGTAEYSGKAAGAHHKTGEGVNWFHGDASLMANFGADDAGGSISGSISNIRVNGGPAMSDSIELREAALTGGSATFNGNARMGAAMVNDDDTVTYPYNGTWSGSFFGATANDADTTDVDESITAPLAAAGTFGVTRTMDMDTTDTADDVVESFVGAFGAHKQ